MSFMSKKFHTKCQKSGGKICYETRGEAKKKSKIIGNRYDTKLYIYHCPFCEYWHFTKKERQKDDVCQITGKFIYKSLKIAIIHARRQDYLKGITDIIWYIKRCQYCNEFHLMNPKEELCKI